MLEGLSRINNKCNRILHTYEEMSIELEGAAEDEEQLLFFEGAVVEADQSGKEEFPWKDESDGTKFTAHGASYKAVGRRFGMDYVEVCTAFFVVCRAVNDKLGHLFELRTDSKIVVVGFGWIAMPNGCGVLGLQKLGIEGKVFDERSVTVQAFSDFSTCSSDISGELQRLANLHLNDGGEVKKEGEREPEPCVGFLQRENFSMEIIENISPEDLQPTVKICIDGLKSSSVAVKRSAAAKLRLLANNRALIGDSGAIPTLIPLLRCTDPWTQEHAVTALLNLSLHDDNKMVISNAGAIKSFVYVLKTVTETSKQNSACALLSLSLVDENKSSIGACGAIPPLVALLLNGSSRGKKDALTTLYKLCSIKCNKERAVSAGTVKPLVALVAMYELPDGDSIPQYILGDCCFPLLPWLLTPYNRLNEEDSFCLLEKKFNSVHARAMGWISTAFQIKLDGEKIENEIEVNERIRLTSFIIFIFDPGIYK